MKAMQKSEKDRLAEEVVDRWVSFQMPCPIKEEYPAGEFNAFATSVRRYVAGIGRDPFIHREIASAINGLVDFLKVERRRAPDAVIYEASRLESLLFYSPIRGALMFRHGPKNFDGTRSAPRTYSFKGVPL